jgi:hypothetical protein
MPNFKVEMDNCSAVTIGGVEYPILVNYLRKNTPKKDPTTPKDGKQRGRPFGVIVALSKDKIGWSICHNIDKWDRKEAIKRAAGRAMRGLVYWQSQFLDYTAGKGSYYEEHVGNVLNSGLPKLIAVFNGLKEMETRATNYFKE